MNHSTSTTVGAAQPGMRRALIIAYRFPPQGGGGVQRTLKFVKYLSCFGWSPVVLTAKNPYWPLWDETLLLEVPDGVRVYRTRTFEVERLERRLRSLWVGNGVGRPMRNGNPLEPAPTGALPRSKGVLSAASQMVHQHVLMPDPQIAWMPWAFAKSLYIVRREAPEVIYTTSPPNSSQVVGLLVKRALKKPWVADFRDPWTEGSRRQMAYEKNGTRQRVEEALEGAVIQHADHVVVTTEKMAEQFIAKYPPVSPHKFSVITNGFDPPDFQHITPVHRHLKAEEFNVTLVGNVETMFDATPFFQAVKGLLEESPEVCATLRVNFVGTKKGKYDALIAQNNLGRHIHYIDYVPHADSVQYLAESDVLFFCQVPDYGSASVQLPGKLFEYLYLRKPILALTVPGVTTDLLERAGLGTVVDPGHASDIKQALYDLYQQWRQGRWRFAPDEAFIRSFERAQLTERLAGIFDAVSGRIRASKPAEIRPSSPIEDTD
jgi:glycosyltransferase involved in cell wall biosynthesis